MSPAPIRIAMWSGPRNISTAMMRSFGARPDTAVIDEPFYAAYLAATGLEHPMRDEVIASQPCDCRDVVAQVLGTVRDVPVDVLIVQVFGASARAASYASFSFGSCAVCAPR